jgi:hypothetical protein
MIAHTDSPLPVQPDALMRAMGNNLVELSWVAWRPKTHPEQFNCLESADPQLQLRASLKQVASLLQENARLIQTVLLLDHALNDAHCLINQCGLISPEDREAAHLSPDFHHSTKQLRARLQARLLE